MAPRQTARRLLVAAPVLALALVVTACSPPGQQPADPDAPYTLPTYSEEAKPTRSEQPAETTTTGVEGAEGEAAGGAQGTGEDVMVPVPEQTVPVADPLAPIE